MAAAATPQAQAQAPLSPSAIAAAAAAAAAAAHGSAAAAGGAKLDSFVSQELESHACAICYDLMLPPDKAPILLFPCGHSFCRECLSAHEKQYKQTCPLCRAKIKSKAPNFALQQIILNLSAKKKELADAKLQQSQSQSQQHSALALALGGVVLGDADAVARYAQQYRMYHARVEVLTNKRADLLHTAMTAEAERAAGALVLQHLDAEEAKVVHQIEALQQELLLIRKHSSEQQQRVSASGAAALSATDAIAVIDRTLEPLRRDRDKARILLQSLAPNLKFDA